MGATILVRRCFAAAVLVWALPATSAAQSASGPHELVVFAGASLVRADAERTDGSLGAELVPGRTLVRTSFDGSAEFGARYARHVTDRVSVGGDFSVAPGHRLTRTIEYGCPVGRLCILSGLPALVPDRQTRFQVVAYHYTAGAGFDLTGGSLRPSVIAGVGGVTFGTEGDRETRFAVRLGGALRAEAGSLSIHLEVQDVIVPDHFATSRVEHDVHARLGLGVRW